MFLFHLFFVNNFLQCVFQVSFFSYFIVSFSNLSTGFDILHVSFEILVNLAGVCVMLKLKR